MRRFLFMADKAYVPTTQYQEQFNTAITKTNLDSGILQYGKRIVAQAINSSAGGVSTVYTVPKGKQFYLTYASLMVYSPTGAVSLMGVGPVAYSQSLIYLISNGDGTYSDHVTPTYPLRFVEGETIQINNNGASDSTIGIVLGYEVDASLLPNFV